VELSDGQCEFSIWRYLRVEINASDKARSGDSSIK